MGKISSWRTLSVALRWALLGMTMSMLSNAIFEGSVVPSILLVGLPAWSVAFRRTFGLAIDFASPAAAWIVQRFGSFRSLAATEGVEGVLCLAVAIAPGATDGYWKWLLLALSCLLLMTGQVIDVASEVFEVDAAAGDDDMLVRYSGYVSVISSVAGTLLGNVLGSAIANASVRAMLLTSAALSFGCALTRFRTRHLMPASAVQSEDSTTFDDSNTTVSSSGTHANQATRIRLLAASLLLALIPSFWSSYTLLGLGEAHGPDILTILYAFGGVGGVVGSLIYARFAGRIGMRRLAVIGMLLTMIALALIAIPTIPTVCVGWLIDSCAYGFLAQAVIVSRVLLFQGGELARFSGRARFVYAVGGAAGTWAGWMLSAQWRLLAPIALILCAGFIPLFRAMPDADKRIRA